MFLYPKTKVKLKLIEEGIYMYTCPNFNQGIINYEYDILIIVKFQRAGNYVNMQKCRSIKNKIDKKFSQPFPYCTSRYIFFLVF